MHKIHVVGLGPGNEAHITVDTWNLLQKGYPIYVRTVQHPTLHLLDENGITYEGLDTFYENAESFEEVYSEIVACLEEKSRHTEIIYAVPGSPQVAEKTVRYLYERAKEGHVNLEVHPAMSFLDVLYQSLGMDPIEGLYITDVFTIEESDMCTKGHIVITQVYNQRVASDLKLDLMTWYEDEAEIIVVHHLSLPDEKIETIPLYMLDRLPYLDHLSSVVIPKRTVLTAREMNASYIIDSEEEALENLTTMMETLRGDGGCPWDKKQTHESLVRYLIEECAEAVEAIYEKDDTHLMEELGDVLFQVVFHAQIAKEEDRFTLQDIMEHVTQKMTRRHPHVFGNVQVQSAEDVSLVWDTVKKQEKDNSHSIMDGIPRTLSALLMAQKIQEKARKVGFVWKNVEGVWDKLQEEMEEFKEAVIKGNFEEMEKEAGDMLFSLINLLDWYKIVGETALYQTNTKFMRRFAYIESMVNASQRSWEDFTLEELDLLWNAAKKSEKD